MVIIGESVWGRMGRDGGTIEIIGDRVMSNGWAKLDAVLAALEPSGPTR
jgi:hypothetical protein